MIAAVPTSAAGAAGPGPAMPSGPRLGLDGEWCGAGRPMLGGRVDVRHALGRPTPRASSRLAQGEPAGRMPGGACDRAEHEARRILDRIDAWAARLTRFDPGSELSRLNRDPRPTVPVGPTLAAVLDWGRVAEVATDGVVDVTLLDARLAAEHGTDPRLPTHRAWSLERGPRGAVVRRPPGVRFDLDGVAKGWLADRALDLLAGSASALVDADGDIAVRVDAGVSCALGIADPRAPRRHLAVLSLPRCEAAATYGVATSGTSVHRWRAGAAGAHHLIDPRTGLPAVTDLVQATVVARTARHAEALAKAVVISGLDAGVRLLARTSAVGAVLLTERGDALVTGGLEAWLA